MVERYVDRFAGKKKEGKVYVAVVGGRSVSDYEFVKRAFFDAVMEEGLDIGSVVIVSGGAKGVDSLARRLARELGLDMVEILPDWERFGKSAGMRRNGEIVRLADVVVAVPAPDSRGTIDAIVKARKMKKKVYVKEYDPSPQISPEEEDVDICPF